MPNELLELGSRTRKRAAPRVCYKVEKAGKGYIVSTRDRKTGRKRAYLAAPCLRTKSRKRAMRIPTKKAAVAYAGKCGFRCGE